MSDVAVTVRWRPARAPGEFGELPPWTSRAVVGEHVPGEYRGDAWDLVLELARTTKVPLVVSIEHGDDVETFWAEHGDVRRVPYNLLWIGLRHAERREVAAEFVCALAWAVRAGLGLPDAEPDGTENALHAGRLLDAMESWAFGRLDGNGLDDVARHALREVTVGESWRTVDVVRCLRSVCALLARGIGTMGRLSQWHDAMVRAIAECDVGRAPGKQVARDVFFDHMTERVMCQIA